MLEKILSMLRTMKMLCTFHQLKDSIYFAKKIKNSADPTL